MFSEDELIPISGLQHVLFCERQYALIHLEQIWEENGFTAEGKALHERVDVEHHESRKLFLQEYGMALRSLEHGFIGKADLTELLRRTDGSIERAIPVEFKHGTDKENDCDRVQLCAQALCLEEMLGVAVPMGQFYYLRDHRRLSVVLDINLREQTLAASRRIREILKNKLTPIAEYSKKKCDSCSLVHQCMPKSAGAGRKPVRSYMELQLKVAQTECQT